MQIVKILMLLLVAPFISNCQKNITPTGPGFHEKDGPGIEPGVSAALSRYRSLSLKNISYELSFAIPPQRDQPVQASERLNFVWRCPEKNDKKEKSDKRTAVPLQLDFRDSAGAISSLTVNDRPVPIVLVREHLLIDASLLKEGGNTMGILFTAGDLSLNRNPDFLYTLLVPDRARTLFPCFDQPDLKAVFTLCLELPNDWKAVANAPLQDSLEEGDHKQYRYLPSDKIPT